MEDKDFDKHIKDQLADFSSKQGTDWEEMHRRLVEEEILEEDALFDEAVKQSVADTQASYKESHWAILREQLLTEAYLRKRLFAAKAVEVVLLLLLVAAVMSVLPVKKQELYAVHKYRPPVTTLSSLWSQGVAAAKQLLSIGEADNVKPSIAQYNQVVGIDQPKPQQKGDDSDLSTWYAHEAAQSVIGIKQELAPLPIASVDGLQYSNRDVAPALVPIDYVTQSQAVQSYLGLTIGAAANAVETPLTTVDGDQTLSLTDINYQAEVNYGIRRGKLEAYTGVGISQTNYTPAATTGLFDRYGGENIPLSQIRDIKYTFLNIPLGIRSHLVQRPRWSLFSLIAVNVNLLARADYTFRELTPTEIKIATSDPEQFGGSNLRADLDSDLSRGLLQGAGLAQSINTSATIGLGLGTRLSSTVGMFLQPSYTKSFSLAGSGAQDERIDNFRFDLGFTFAL